MSFIQNKIIQKNTFFVTPFGLTVIINGRLVTYTIHTVGGTRKVLGKLRNILQQHVE